MPWADAFAEDDQKRKDRIQDFRASLKETRAANPLPFKDVLEGQFLGVAKHRYGLPIQQYLRTLLAIETGAGGSGHTHQLSLITEMAAPFSRLTQR